MVGSIAIATLATRGRPPKITLPTTPASDTPIDSGAQAGALLSKAVS